MNAARDARTHARLIKEKRDNAEKALDVQRNRSAHDADAIEQRENTYLNLCDRYDAALGTVADIDVTVAAAKSSYRTGSSASSSIATASSSIASNLDASTSSDVLADMSAIRGQEDDSY